MCKFALKICLVLKLVRMLQLVRILQLMIRDVFLGTIWAIHLGTHQFYAFAVGSAMALEVVYADYYGSKQ